MNDVSFGQWLSNYRKSIGLTQKQLAECLNCATITLRKIEGEQRRPSLQLIERMMQTLEIPASEQSAFSRFARGYQTSILPIGKMNTPWRQTNPTHISNLPDSRMPQGWQDQDVQSKSRNLQDPKLHTVALVGQDGPGQPVYWQVTQQQLFQSQDEAYLLMLVPMKILNQLLQTVFQSRNTNVESISSPHAQFSEPIGNQELSGIFDQLFAPLNIRPNIQSS